MYIKLHFPDAPKEPSLLLVLKWGGELTPAGRVQVMIFYILPRRNSPGSVKTKLLLFLILKAEELGKVFRCMYPGGQGEGSLFY